MKAIMVLITALFLAACGSQVEVPPAHVGKILTKNGYAPETIPPSKFRLPPCWAYCDKLVLLQANDTGFKEELKVFMPDDKLNLSVEVRGTLTVPTSQNIVDAIYDRVTSAEHSSNTNIITATTVYSTYGQQALRGIVRSEIVKYTIADVLEKREQISNNIHAAISEKLKATNTPLIVSRFELADIQPPAVIVAAQQAAKEREIDIQKAEADAQVDLVKAEKELEIAKKNRLVEREKAEAIAEQNRIAANSITPEVLAYKQLETLQAVVEAAASNGNTIFLPIPTSGEGMADLTSSATLAKLIGREMKR